MKSPKCKKCGAPYVTRKGFSWRAGRRLQKWQCQGCGHCFVEQAKEA